MRKNALHISTAIAIILFLGLMVVETVKDTQFDLHCTQYIKRAADASTVETAKEELAKAISYAEEHGMTEGNTSIFLKQPQDDVGFWYRNMKNAYHELDNLPDDSSALEKANVLMKVRESLVDQGESSVMVTLPQDLSIFPNNVLYFWVGAFLRVYLCLMLLLEGVRFWNNNVVY